MMRAREIQAHSDYLNISIPYLESGGFQDAVLEAVGMALPHAWPERPGLFEIGRTGRQVGTLKFTRRGQVFVTSVSGTGLAALRNAGCFPDFLWCFADQPHRVTHLDAALDICGEEASPTVLGLYRRGIEHEFRLSQRKAPVSCHLTIGAAGRETGTVYIGGKDARVRLAIYDKREERLAKGQPDPGPRIRYELRFRGGENGVPLTLKDAADPTSVFWHYMPPEILLPPVGVDVVVWIKSNDVGYDLPTREERPPDAKLRRWVEKIGIEGVAMADALGPQGRGLLAMLLGLGTKTKITRA